MNIVEYNQLRSRYSKKTSDELEKEYFKILYNDVLGSRSEAMAEAGYEISDIEEQRELEEYADKVTDIIAEILFSRGIDVWEERT